MIFFFYLTLCSLIILSLPAVSRALSSLFSSVLHSCNVDITKRLSFSTRSLSRWDGASAWMSWEEENASWGILSGMFLLTCLNFHHFWPSNWPSIACAVFWPSLADSVGLPRRWYQWGHHTPSNKHLKCAGLVAQRTPEQIITHLIRRTRQDKHVWRVRWLRHYWHTLCLRNSSSGSPLSFKQAWPTRSAFSRSARDSSNLRMRLPFVSATCLHSKASCIKAWSEQNTVTPSALSTISLYRMVIFSSVENKQELEKRCGRGENFQWRLP